MTVKRAAWAVTAGLWMAGAAAGLAMGAEQAEKGPAYDTVKAAGKDEAESRGPAGKTIPAAVKRPEGGWVKEDGNLRYKDSKGNYAVNDWKDRDGKSYYLGSDGNIEKSAWIANTYYVDSSGAMVRNQWIHSDGGLKEEGWYYLGKDGKAEEDGWKNIEDGRYCFDSDGRLRTGWYYEGDNIYYLGENGAMSRGWRCLEFNEDKLPAEGEVSKEYKTAGEDAKWFYFQSNGKVKRAETKAFKDTTINGRKYYFDENGVMLTGWHAVRPSAQSGDAVGISRFVYLGGKDDGYLVKGQWKELSTHPGGSEEKGILNHPDSGKGPREGEKEWYYFENNGAPAYLNTTARTMNGAVTKVDGEAYFLDPYGCRQTGLVKVKAGGTVLTGYFGSRDSDGRMRTGRIDGLVDGSGETHTFYFATSGSGKGAGFSGEKDGSLYYDGILVAAKEGTGYQPFKVDGRVYLVNTAGRIQTNEKAYKVDGVYKYRLEDGILYHTDSKGEKGVKVTGGAALPRVSCDKEYSFS